MEPPDPTDVWIKVLPSFHLQTNLEHFISTQNPLHVVLKFKLKTFSFFIENGFFSHTIHPDRSLSSLCSS